VDLDLRGDDVGERAPPSSTTAAAVSSQEVSIEDFHAA
jgi:hypothetical protein